MSKGHVGLSRVLQAEEMLSPSLGLPHPQNQPPPPLHPPTRVHMHSIPGVHSQGKHMPSEREAGVETASEVDQPSRLKASWSQDQGLRRPY